MEQRKTIINAFAYKGLGLGKALLIGGIKRSTYYYQSNGKHKGKPCSTHTLKTDGSVVANETVVQSIIDLITPEYHDYGYIVVTHLLREQGHVINPKKVYRLMRENNLLHQSIPKNKGEKRERIKFAVPPLDKPFATIEADIKHVYIHEQNRNAYLITFLCTFCRYALIWEIDYHMKSNQIINLVNQLNEHPLIKRFAKDYTVKIRTDNGPQFIAKELAATLNLRQIKHEFIHPATPQENGHIESFHNTVSRLVCNKNIFNNLPHAKQIFNEFYSTYNNTRAMARILYRSPLNFLKEWESGKVEIIINKKNKQEFFFREKPVQKIETDFSPEDFFVQNKISNFTNHF
jgi:putative transposase